MSNELDDWQEMKETTGDVMTPPISEVLKTVLSVPNPTNSSAAQQSASSQTITINNCK